MGFLNAALFPLFDFVAKNRWVQYLLLCITGLIVVRMWLWFHDEQTKKLAKAHAVEETRKTIEKIEERSNAHIDQADRIRAANPVSPSDPRMSDAPLSGFNYRD